MKNLKELFTHEQIMAEYSKLCARLGYTPEELNFLLGSPFFHDSPARDLGKVMSVHYRELKKEHNDKKLKSPIMKELVFYAANFTREQVLIKKEQAKRYLKS